MIRLRNISIQHKLVLIIMAGGTVALCIACVAFVMEDQRSFRKATVEEMETLAGIVAFNCAPAVSIGTSGEAVNILRTLELKTPIDLACVYDTDGRLFGKWVRDGAEADLPKSLPEADAYEFSGGFLHMFYEIRTDDEKWGVLYIRSGLTQLESRWRHYVIIAFLILGGSLLVTWRISARLQRIISEPIFSLLESTETVARNQDYSIRARAHGEDELGLLVQGFNNMLAQVQARDIALQQAHENLEKTVEARTRELKLEIEEREMAEKKLTALHRELLETSRQAGMAEVATGVLHNVGNVLNSVNVSTILIGERLRRSKFANLRKIAALIQKHAGDLDRFVTDDEKGQRLAQYVKDLAEHLDGEQAESLKELNLLTTNIEHIKEIVATQQSYASVSGVIEALPLVDLIEDALRMYVSGFQAKDIVVAREYLDEPIIAADKHRVLQIVANLIANAQDSVLEAARPEGKITLRIALVGDARVRLEVADDGVGIHPDNLTRIFSHGFTTKRDGHGFGLHYSALAAREMVGSLTAESDGENCGATFVLELPLSPPQTGRASSVLPQNGSETTGSLDRRPG